MKNKLTMFRIGSFTMLLALGYFYFLNAQNGNSDEGNYIPNNTDITYFVNNQYGRSIGQEELENCNRIEDIIHDYPTNWIDNYEKVIMSNELSLVEGPNNIFGENQKKWLQDLKVNDQLQFQILFYNTNSVTEEVTLDTMRISYHVVPTEEATYPGGMENFIRDLQANSPQILVDFLANTPMVHLNFTVNKNGEVENINFKDSSGDKEVDQVLIDLLSKSKKWNPAKDRNGNSISQQLTLTYGLPGC